MLRSWMMAVAVAGSAGLLGASAANAESVNLTPRFEAGKSDYVEIRSESELTMKMGEQPAMDMKFGTLYGMLYTPEKVDKGARVKLTFDRAMQYMEAAMMGGRHEYDTDRKEAEDASEQFADVCDPMIGESITMEVGPDGQVAAVKGMNQLVERIKEAAAGNPFAAQLTQQLNDDTAKLMFGDTLLAAFPGREVKVGESWKRTTTMPHPMLGTMTMAYTFKLDRVTVEAGRKLAAVVFEQHVTQDPGAKPTPGPMGAMKLKKGLSTGTIMIDVAGGTLASQTSDVQMDFGSDPPPPAAGEGADAAPRPTQSLTQKIRVKVSRMSTAERAAQKKAAAEEVRKAAAKKAEPSKTPPPAEKPGGE